MFMYCFLKMLLEVATKVNIYAYALKKKSEFKK